MNETPKTPKRWLAAIVHADIIGFSALMSADESGTQAAVTTIMQRASAMAQARGGALSARRVMPFLPSFRASWRRFSLHRTFKRGEEMI